MGKAFQDNGILCVMPDYRNFPSCDIRGMVADLEAALEWVHEHGSELGGDINNITLIGQSAGCNITSLLFVNKNNDNFYKRTWKVSKYVGISGVYSLKDCASIWRERGLPDSLVKSIFNNNIDDYSPIQIIEQLSETEKNELVEFFPEKSYFIHGTADLTAPCEQSSRFAKSLRSLGIKPEVLLLAQKTHTDLILEDAVLGNDQLMLYLLDIVKPNVKEKT
eukprot:UN24283